MKKLIAIICMLLLTLINVYANSTTSSNNTWYNTPIIDESLNFSAKYADNVVYMNWNKLSKNEWFKYYKVIKSQEISNPVYPDNWYITAISDINTLEYTDKKPTSWVNYYRVCAITSEMNRYCSNVIKLNIEKTTQTFCTMDAKVCPDWSYVGRTWPNCEFSACPTNSDDKLCTKEYSPVCWKVKIQCIKAPCEPITQTFSNKCELSKNSLATFLYEGECKNNTTWWNEYNYNLSYTIKLKADKIINQFIEKVEKIYENSDKKISVLNNVIEKLNNLATTKPEQKQLIDYIIYKLKAKIDFYKWNDLWDIESIFNEIQ